MATYPTLEQLVQLRAEQHLQPLVCLCIHYEIKDCFPISASCVTLANPRFTFQQWNASTFKNKSWKKNTYLNDVGVRNPLVEYISQRSEITETSQPLLRVGKFQTPAWKQAQIFYSLCARIHESHHDWSAHMSTQVPISVLWNLVKIKLRACDSFVDHYITLVSDITGMRE
jgi:hypothetical protein